MLLIQQPPPEVLLAASPLRERLCPVRSSTGNAEFGYKGGKNTTAKLKHMMTTGAGCNYNICTVPAVPVTQCELSGHADTSYFTLGSQTQCMGRTRAISQDTSKRKETALAHSQEAILEQSCRHSPLFHKAAAAFFQKLFLKLRCL